MSFTRLHSLLKVEQASASTAVALAVMSQQSLKDPQVTAAISLAPIQLAGVVVGTMLASVFLSFAVGFVLMRVRNKEKSNPFNDKGPARDPKMQLSRDSMTIRPGNSVVIKFSPPTSVHDIPPAPERYGSLLVTPSALEKEQVLIATVLDTKVTSNNPFASRTGGWPLTASFNDNLDGTSNELWPQTTIPHNTRAQNSGPTPDSPSATGLHFEESQEIASTIKFASPPGPEVIDTSQEMELDEDSRPIREPARESRYELATDQKSERLVKAAAPLEDPLKDPDVESHASFVDGLFRDLVGQSSEQPKRASTNTLADDDYLEELVDQEAKVSWIRPDETLLDEDAEGAVTREVEDLLPEPGTSSLVVVAHTQNPGVPYLPGQSETSSQRSSFQYVRTTSPEQKQCHVPGEASSSGTQASVNQSLPQSTDGTIPPLRRNPAVSLPERRVESLSPDTANEEREISPLRRNPPFEPFESIISLFNEQQGLAIKLKGEDADEHESRGRSMIRTSDIIEARLSGVAQSNNPQEEILQRRGIQGEADDSGPATPATPQRFTASDQIRRLHTPPKRKSVSGKQSISAQNSPPLTSNLLARPVSATSAAITPRREEQSPLRRNPPGVSPPPRRALGAGSTASSSTKEFSQALSKFQTLISQNPQDAVVASNEVTSRAIAGIYIPGSLREQAVRNLSKSRERGTGERQRK